MNCAHLENCLHEAREEARTNKCSADRRAVEYDALRSSALRIHGLFERLNGCVTAPGVTGFADSLRSLAVSLARYCIAVIFVFIICSKLQLLLSKLLFLNNAV
jgi:hypothetical protein